MAGTDQAVFDVNVCMRSGMSRQRDKGHGQQQGQQEMAVKTHSGHGSILHDCHSISGNRVQHAVYCTVSNRYNMWFALNVVQSI